mmetsp:Transcript_56834/g.65114  ORF Transcript_56834/g.65114 Transcript_56834/m.65114 type:complete len:107 (+) Transcript_56834:48-368(+)
MSQKLFNAFVELSEGYHNEKSHGGVSGDKEKNVPPIQRKKVFKKKAKVEYNKQLLTKNLKSMLNKVKKYSDKNNIKSQNLKYLKLMNEKTQVTDKIKQILLQKSQS